MKIIHALKKTFATAAASFMIVSSALPVTVNADNKVYNVDNALFTLNIEPDGSAVVSEKWTVTFISGSFTRFCKDICSPANQLEYIAPDDITVLECNINDIPARLNSGQREDGHYFIDLNNPNPTINWYHNASDETVTYDITYRINNAVKLNENDRAMLSYRFIGDDFSKTVDHTGLSINLPQADDSAKCDVNYGTTNYLADKGVFTNDSENVSGIYKAELEMDPAVFDGLKRIVDVNVPERVQRSVQRSAESSDLKGLWFFAGFAVFIIGLCIFASSAKSKVRRTFQKDPDHFKRAADELESYGFPFMFYFINSSPKQNHLSKMIMTEMIDLYKKGRLSFEDEGFRIRDNVGYGSDDDIMQCDNEFLSFISGRSLDPNSKSYDINFIRYADFRNGLDNKQEASNIYQWLSRWEMKYLGAVRRNQSFKETRKDKTFKKALSTIWQWANYASDMTPGCHPSDCFGMMKRNQTPSLYTVLEMLNTYKFSSASGSSDDLPFFLFCSAFSDSAFAQYDIQKSAASSSDSSGSGCSSCSSCGGCGGCGGGGAD